MRVIKEATELNKLSKQRSAFLKAASFCMILILSISLTLSSCSLILSSRTNNEDKVSVYSKVKNTVEAMSETVDTLSFLGSSIDYTPLTSKKWADINEEMMSSLDGLGYWEDIPGFSFGQCTGFVSWVAIKCYGILDYPHSVSTDIDRNGGEFVSSQRKWLRENALLVGTATTNTGEIVYKGGRYKPGDIIVFNSRPDGSEGKLYEMPMYDYWGDEDTDYFTHIAVVGSNTTMWKEELDLENETAKWEAVGTLPEGQYNMHHNVESHGGICNELSPEQFITRNVPADNPYFSRSFEVYRLLAG